MGASDTSGLHRPPNNIDTMSVRPEDLEAQERAQRVLQLKAQIKSGTYRADIKDIAMQLAAAMDPLM